MSTVCSYLCCDHRKTNETTHLKHSVHPTDETKERVHDYTRFCSTERTYEIPTDPEGAANIQKSHSSVRPLISSKSGENRTKDTKPGTTGQFQAENKYYVTKLGSHRASGLCFSFGVSGYKFWGRKGPGISGFFNKPPFFSLRIYHIRSSIVIAPARSWS